MATGEQILPGRVIVGPVEATAPLAGAVYDKQQLLARDACGAAGCGTQSFVATNFGRESAIEGDVAAVTTVESTTPAPREQAVHIYTRGASAWEHSARFFLGQNRGTRDVAVGSGRVFVGRGTISGVGSFSDGSVLVYERVGGSWTQTATLTPSDPASLAAKFVGDSISVQGDTVALGAYGFVYIFQRNTSGAWTEVRKLPVSPLTSTTAFAHSVALSADYLVVGARFDSPSFTNQGSVFVYRRSDWSLDQKLTANLFTPTGVEFGYAVAIDGTTLMAGAPNGSQGGFVNVRERTGSGTTPWVSRATLQPSNGGAYRVGTSVSLVGNLALLGAPLDPLTGPQGGAAYLVTRGDSGWNVANSNILLPRDNGRGGDPGFGWSVQLNGSRAIVSAPKTDVRELLRRGCGVHLRGARRRRP